MANVTVLLVLALGAWAHACSVDAGHPRKLAQISVRYRLFTHGCCVKLSVAYLCGISALHR